MNLTHDPADVLRYLLISLGLGTLPTASGSWPVHVNNEPDTPDKSITVYNTQGNVNGRIQNTGSFVEFPGIQVRVRSLNYGEGYAKGNLIVHNLDTVVYRESVTISSSVYLVHALNRTGSLLFLGKDSPSSKRPIFTVNYTVTIEQES